MRGRMQIGITLIFCFLANCLLAEADDPSYSIKRFTLSRDRFCLDSGFTAYCWGGYEFKKLPSPLIQDYDRYIHDTEINVPCELKGKTLSCRKKQYPEEWSTAISNIQHARDFAFVKNQVCVLDNTVVRCKSYTSTSIKPFTIPDLKNPTKLGGNRGLCAIDGNEVVCRIKKDSPVIKRLFDQPKEVRTTTIGTDSAVAILVLDKRGFHIWEPNKPNIFHPAKSASSLQVGGEVACFLEGHQHVRCWYRTRASNLVEAFPVPHSPWAASYRDHLTYTLEMIAAMGPIDRTFLFELASTIEELDHKEKSKFYLVLYSLRPLMELRNNTHLMPHRLTDLVSAINWLSSFEKPITELKNSISTLELKVFGLEILKLSLNNMSPFVGTELEVPINEMVGKLSDMQLSQNIEDFNELLAHKAPQLKQFYELLHNNFLLKPRAISDLKLLEVLLIGENGIDPYIPSVSNWENEQFIKELDCGAAEYNNHFAEIYIDKKTGTRTGFLYTEADVGQFLFAKVPITRKEEEGKWVWTGKTRDGSTTIKIDPAKGLTDFGAVRGSASYASLGWGSGGGEACFLNPSLLSEHGFSNVY